MKYSFVIPCYNSEKTIIDVVNEINNTMIKKDDEYEIILINDYSCDKTNDVIFELAKNKNITALEMSRNFGQHAALLAGYKHVKGEYIISLDDDGQTPANEVYTLINKIDEGYDVVFASYPNKHHSIFRNLGSKINDIMACKLIDKPKDLYLSSYFIARRFVIDDIVKYTGPYPYVSGLLLRTSKSITNVEVNHRNRELGESGYTFKKLFKLWLNGFTAFSIKPLRISMLFGLMIAFFGFIMTCYVFINKMTNPSVPLGWTSTVATILVIGGAILMVLGMIGEYIGRIYITLNTSSQYIIREKRDHENEY